MPNLNPLDRMAERAGNYAYRLGQGEAYVEELVKALDRAYEGMEMPPEVQRLLSHATVWLKGGE